jgi:hypothetical protein
MNALPMGEGDKNSPKFFSEQREVLLSETSTFSDSAACVKSSDA